MSQSWTDDVFAAGHVGQTDLQNMEYNFACLKSLFSGASQPASMGACHPWFDSAKHVLKVRNDGDTAWLGLMHGDTSQKLWIYRNAAMNGWAIDSAVSDKVLALKGGGTYTTGGVAAGNWTLPDHVLTINEMPSHDHSPGAISAGAHTHSVRTYYSTDHGGYIGPNRAQAQTSYQDIPYSALSAGAHTHSITAQGGGAAHNHGSTYRPSAAVGTLQYLDL
jgi:hypothetical protein